MTDYRTRVHNRLTELLALREGWLDGQGAKIGPAVIATAATIAESTAQWAGEVGIFPTLEGGVQIEWSDEHASHSITIGPDLRIDLDTTGRSGAKQRDPHRYLSTGCFHGDLVLPDGRTGHEYCQGEVGAVGAKKPAKCKHCPAKCRCLCHQ